MQPHSFQTYSTALCCMDRRIRKALELCKCKPHFYAVASDLPVCNIDQLLCLQRNNWAQTNCTDCVQLCEYMFYVQLQQSLSPAREKEGFLSQKFERTAVIQLSLPYRGIRRRVVFSSDQLVVSFGGAVSLFLGASFMTCYTMIKIFGDFVALNCRHFWRQQQQPQRRKLVRVQPI
ncbi:pickpocket protein 11-like [Anastrepha ludens]|uniref:pickpocket protein 11-like n=1 Tax=Anastrepha ludens TaxID=28586 RepID=UPI0023AECEAF|nr:pickpocket protein 11-like [Anastrepha ludens]